MQEIEADLPHVNLPCLIIYADQDPVVSIDSADEIFGKITSENKELVIIKAQHHGVLMDNTENT